MYEVPIRINELQANTTTNRASSGSLDPPQATVPSSPTHLGSKSPTSKPLEPTLSLALPSPAPSPEIQHSLVVHQSSPSSSGATSSASPSNIRSHSSASYMSDDSTATSLSRHIIARPTIRLSFSMFYSGLEVATSTLRPRISRPTFAPTLPM